MEQADQDRERSLELLRAAHSFPGPFQFRIVVHPGREEHALGAVRAAIGSDDALFEVSTQASRTGRYISVRATATVEHAEMVLTVYAFLKGVEGVITVF